MVALVWKGEIIMVQSMLEAEETGKQRKRHNDRQKYTHLDFRKEVSDKYINLGVMSIELLL